MDIDVSVSKKLRHLERSLAPVRKSADILTRTIEAGGNSLLSGPDLAVIAGSVVAAACIMTFELIMRRDPSVSTVSAATIEALIEPARHLEPLARHLASINPLEWVFPSSGDACPGDLMRERIEALFECVRRAAISFLFIVEDHPQGRHLAAIGKIPDAPLTAAVWALAPAMNWEQGTDPLKSRKLVLDWSECLFLSVQVANALERRTEPMPDGMVPMLGKILEAVAGAVAEGGAEEKHKASLCITTVFLQFFWTTGTIFVDEEAGPERFGAFVKHASAPGNVEFLLESIKALRASPPSAADDKSTVLYLSAIRLAAAACAACGYYLTAAAGPTLADKFQALCSPLLIECLHHASSCWVEVVRRGPSVPGFSCSAREGQAATTAISYFLLSIKKVLQIQANRADWLDAVSKKPHSADICALAAQGARAAADVAAMLPTAIPVFQAGFEAGQANGRTTLDVLKFNMAINAPLVALIYARISETAGVNEDVPIQNSGRSDAVQAAHACTRAVLTLQGVDHPKGRHPAEPVLAIAEQRNAVDLMYAATVAFAEALEKIDFAADSLILVVLHALTAAVAIPVNLQGSAITPADAKLFSTVLRRVSEALVPVLLPMDAAGLEHVGQRGGPDAAAKLQGLIVAAKSSEGLEQRQRRRLELMGRLPGVCASLGSCTKVPLADDQLKVCSGCYIARFCSPSCFKYDWKHGGFHKAACKAAQWERDGGG